MCKIFIKHGKILLKIDECPTRDDLVPGSTAQEKE